MSINWIITFSCQRFHDFSPYVTVPVFLFNSSNNIRQVLSLREISKCTSISSYLLSRYGYCQLPMKRVRRTEMQVPENSPSFGLYLIKWGPHLQLGLLCTLWAVNLCKGFNFCLCLKEKFIRVYVSRRVLNDENERKFRNWYKYFKLEFKHVCLALIFFDLSTLNCYFKTPCVNPWNEQID